MIKRLLFFSLLFLASVSFGQEQTDPPIDNTTVDLSHIEYRLDEITDGYFSTWSRYFIGILDDLEINNEYLDINNQKLESIEFVSYDIGNNLYTIIDILNTIVENGSISNELSKIRDKVEELVDGYSPEWNRIFRSLEEDVEDIKFSTASIDSTTKSILQEIEGNEDRENTNASNIQSIKDILENFAPSFDSMVSSLANIESNTSYGDINYNNEDLINYLNDNHFDDFYITFHGYTDAFVPTYLGYMSWSSFGISGNKDRDILRSWRPESIPYDNFFIQVCHYLDNLANMSANANKSLMMIYDSIETVETNELVEAMERKISEIESQQSALEAAFSAFYELEDNITFEKFEEFVKTGSEGKVDLGYILVPGEFNEELDLGFFPTEWNNRPINVGNLYVRVGVLQEYLLVCRDIFAVVYIFLITIFILWIVRKMLPILSKLFTTLNSIVVWK